MSARIPVAAARLLVLLVAGLLFSAGWTASKTVLAAVWCVAAVRTGWDDARARGTG